MPNLKSVTSAGTRTIGGSGLYRILNVIPDATSCAYYRHVLPAVHLRDELLAHGIQMDVSVAFSDTREYDAYIFSRTYHPRVFPTTLALYEQGATIVWELDDDLPSIPTYSPVKKAFGPDEIKMLGVWLGLASLVSCSTQRLANSTEAFYPGARGKTRVAENLIDPRPYEPFSLTNRQADASPLRLMFAGSHTHMIDMGPVLPLADHVLESDDAYLLWWGYRPEKYATAHPNKMMLMGLSPRSAYEAQLALAAPHIGLCPLLDCHFNTCKSSIKWMEYSAAGAASIASNVPPFADDIIHSETGLLINDDGWLDAYRQLKDPAERGQIAARAREVVLSEYSWLADSRRRRGWLDFYLSIPDSGGA